MKTAFLILILFVSGSPTEAITVTPRQLNLDVTEHLQQTLRKVDKQRLQEGYAVTDSEVFPKATQPPVSDVDCMAEAIFWEARGEPANGQRLVGQVIMNRLASKKFPNTICGVVKHKVRGNYQFSYLHRKNLTIDKKSVEYLSVLKIAYEVLEGRTENLVSLKYYKVCNHPSSFFDNKLEYEFRNNNHCFFREKEGSV